MCLPLQARPAGATIEERLQALEERQADYDRELAAKDARIQELEAELARLTGREVASAPAPAVDPQPVVETRLAESHLDASNPFGEFTPGRGFTVARTDYGELQLSVYSYLRYLNQRGLDSTYVDHFGEVRQIDTRGDFELNKLFLYTQGWFLDPKFGYAFYVWASGPTIGTSNGILAGGSLRYTFNEGVTLSGGVVALPSTRSMDGQFPLWDRVDARLIADEFMRGGFTQGFALNGAVSETLRYKAALANNLSAFGVSASRLDDRMDTFSAALIWMPTTGEFGPRANFGDFEYHENLATLFSARVTTSTEDRESQPGQDAPENTQIRLSDGLSVFIPGALAPGVAVTRLDYQMFSVSGGLKYRGFYLEAEAYRRRLDNFRATGILPMNALTDDGMQVQGSAMLVPSTFQLYAGASKIWGESGDPWDVMVGVNWWPWKKRGFRINGELVYLEGSPVGSPTAPHVIGGTGWVFVANAELAF